MLPKSKPRLPRVQRSEESLHVEEGSDLWAVSYADFLMVLLSFFVIFYSVDKGKSGVLERIVEFTKNPNSNSDHLSKDSKTQSSRQAALAKELQVLGAKVELQSDQRKIIVQFADDIFIPGKTNLKPSAQSDFLEILNKLIQFKSSVNITIVGHTDERPVSKSKSVFLSDNFDLSSLRATKALQLAVKAGFSPHKLSAKGTAEFQRKTRSLSLILEETTP